MDPIDSPITRVVDLWVEITLTGHILEFPEKNSQSTSKDEEKIIRGARGRLLKEVPLWINT